MNTPRGLLCPGWESNPYALMDTWPSTMPVYQFQHLGSWISGTNIGVFLDLRNSRDLIYVMISSRSYL